MLFKVQKHNGSRQHAKYQQGSVLLWGLLILLVLTVLGVTAARMGITDTRIVGNQMYSMITYQTAESHLNRIRPPLQALAPDNSLAYIKLTMDEATKSLTLAPVTSALLTQASTVTSAVTMRYAERLTMCPPQEGYAMRIEMLQDSGGYDCHSFILRSSSGMNGTAARSIHEIGLLHYTPALGSSL